MDRADEKRMALFRTLAAKFLQNESNGSSLVTVTGGEMRERGSCATIFLSVLPEEKSDEALAFAKRKRSEFRLFVKTKVKIAALPRFDFIIDKGEKNRQRIETLAKASAT